ncbi:beta-galactosidase [Neobacillus sp. NPDC093182]|uniref:beta-galactosidase n=1 Tax=Neobacillus sp. NPDC093182 TaxID=3364297 RepID=UPI003809F777
MVTKTVIFYDETFPFEGQRPPIEMIQKLKEQATVVKAGDLEHVLQNHLDVECFIHLHGSFFPKKAWGAIISFLQKGKGFVCVGAAPFRKPCNRVNGSWTPEREQTAYHMELNIHEVLKVDQKPIEKLTTYLDIPVFEGYEELFSVQDTANFIMHPTKTSSIVAEMGSSGPMDARIFPLLRGISKSGREVAAPAVLIENYGGSFTGGRWVFINQLLTEGFWSEKGSLFLNKLADFTSSGVTEFWLKTNYASYYDHEVPMISLQAQSLLKENSEWGIELILKKNGTILEVQSSNVSVTDELVIHHFTLHTSDYQPGLYELMCRLFSQTGEERILRQGFWFMDRELLESGEPLKCGRDYFLKNNQPFPIVGMTYMTSDVARYFLFLPNPSVWNKDFSSMAAAGINYVRTGIWTAWRQMMFVDGHMSESVLRAIDAFILTAKQHDIELTFNFFSFTPEEWDGKNPYLDPRSVSAQKRFISSVVSRHKTTKNIHWDLINEPSLFHPQQTFAGPRTIQDTFDVREYQEWLQNRHVDIAHVQERWNMTPSELPSFSSVRPPLVSQNTPFGNKGLKWLDYTLYTMEKHNQWVQELKSTIKKLAGDQLVTVGQDEALAGQRPSPLFYGKAVDYTTNHSWWMMDQLLWDGIFAKTFDKPNLIQETGIMYVEKPNNHAKRSEEELRNILERKYAYAFAAGNAGAVQWIWNTNYFMNNINESNIGALRADGTEKPETNVSYDFGRFMKAIGHLFQGRKLEEIAVVFPYSNDFSNRRFAFDSTAKLTRVLAYELNQPFRGFSEYDLSGLAVEPPKLVMVPSPHNFSSGALEELLSFVKHNEVTLLFTGPLSIDEYWNETNRVEEIAGSSKCVNVLREEMLQIAGAAVPVSFGGTRIAELVKEIAAEEKGIVSVKEFDYGKGRIIWSPLPIELNEQNASIYELYKYALGRAEVSNHLIWHEGDFPGIYGRKVEFDHGKLLIFVSEFGADANIKVSDPATGQTYEFRLESERSVLFATDKTGEILGIYRENEVNIDLKEGVKK